MIFQKMKINKRGLMEEIKNEIKKYVNKFSDTIATTLGPGGHTVMITDKNGTFLTKDGVTVARNLKSETIMENSVWNLMREACEKTVTSCGDGTTSTAVLTAGFYNSISNMLESNIRRKVLFSELDQFLELIINNVSKETIDIKSKEDIYNISLLSSNGDREIATLVSEALEIIGVDGSIKVNSSKTGKSYVEYHDGYSYGSGYASFEFTNTNKYTCEFDDAVILVYNGKMLFGSEFKNLMQKLADLNKPIVLVANDFEETVLATLIHNVKKKSNFNLVAINSPYFGNKKINSLHDLCVMTGATLFSDDHLPLSEFDASKHLGFSKSVICTRNKTLFIDSNFNQDKYLSWVNKLKMDLVESIDESEQNELTFRISQLSSSAVIIHLYSHTPAELLERQHRLEDAISAATTAIRGGMVVAGGGPVLRALQTAKKECLEFEYEDLVKNIFSRASYHLYDKLYNNLDTHASSIRNRLLVSDRFEYCNYENLNMDKELNFVEPFFVIKQSFVNALAVAKLLTSLNVHIVNNS
jgi:chaperonin GroEL